MLAEANSTDTEDPAGKPAVDLGAQSRLMQVPRPEGNENKKCVVSLLLTGSDASSCVPFIAGSLAVQAASIAEPSSSSCFREAFRAYCLHLTAHHTLFPSCVWWPSSTYV